MTSNLGSSYLLEGIGEDGMISEDAKQAVLRELRRSFRPEFLNRLDEIIMFRPLTRENLTGITGIMLDSLKKRLEERQLGLEISGEALDYIIDCGYDPLYGARPLRRFIQNNVETLIAKEILSGDLGTGSVLHVDLKEGRLICSAS